MTEVDRWSHTRLDMLSKCGQQFAFRYIEGIVIPPSIAMAKGTSIHTTQQANYDQKIETHQDLPKSDIVDIAVENFRAQASGELTLEPEEAAKGIRAVVASTIDRTADLAGYWRETAAADYQPVLVEDWFELEVPNSPPVVGVLDLLDDKQRLVDLKTSRRKKSQDEADSSFQLTIYAAATKKLTGEYPESIRLDNLVQTPGGNKSRVVLETERDRADLVALMSRLKAANSVVSAGAFMPAPPGSWWCSKKFCGYWNICPHVQRK